MTTRGDQILDRTLSKVGGKGLFVKELEVAMAEGRADLAVHCLKDMPMELPEGFLLGAVLEREDARDAFVSNDYDGLDALPDGAIVGTSSLRRQALIASRYPRLVIKPLRGNLDTRLGKLDRGEYAAIILAAAGLKRLGLEHRIRALLDPDSSLPAPGQGTLAIEIPDRVGGVDLIALLAPLHHLPSAQVSIAERKVSQIFGGSCQVPLASYAVIDGDQMHLRAMVATPDGQRMVRAEVRGAATDAALLGEQVAEMLQGQDAVGILAECLSEAAQADDDARSRELAADVKADVQAGVPVVVNQPNLNDIIAGDPHAGDVDSAVMAAVEANASAEAAKRAAEAGASDDYADQHGAGVVDASDTDDVNETDDASDTNDASGTDDASDTGDASDTDDTDDAKATDDADDTDGASDGGGTDDDDDDDDDDDEPVADD
jgi:hydroxymethylbilane synthase